MNVLVGCESSGVVREAFRRRGHNAWSCDLLPTEDGSRFHYKCDLRDLLAQANLGQWDLFIVHPECRYLANSGVCRLYVDGKKANGVEQVRWIKMQQAAAFFRLCLGANVLRICVENPVMHGYAKTLIGGIDPSQTIQPYQFGEDASKRTCLWLKGLPPLTPTKIITKRRYGNQTPSGQNKLGPSPQRPALRSKTYQGVAEAMAVQWGGL